MNKYIGIIISALIVFSFAGPAAAYFDLGSMHMVVYEEIDNAIPNTATSGTNEWHYDLGAFDATGPIHDDNIDATVHLADGAIDTGLQLSDFDATSWDDIYIAIFGRDYIWFMGNPYPDFESPNLMFASAWDDTVTSISYNNKATFYSFTDAMRLAPYNTASNSFNVAKSASWAYIDEGLGESGSPGRFGAYVSATGKPFNSELRLAADGSGTMYFFGGDADLEVITMDNANVFAFWVDGDGSLNVDFQPVPVPGTLLLLASGLLGLIGFRRRSAVAA